MSRHTPALIKIHFFTLCLGLTLALAVGTAQAGLYQVSAALSLISKVQSLHKTLTPVGMEPVAIPAPTPLAGGSGHYVVPYTSQHTLTAWADKGRAAQASGIAGGTVGGYAATTAATAALGKVPGGGLVAGMFGKKAKEKATESAAAVAMGGWDFIRSNSEYSFNTAEELAVYLHSYYAEQPTYSEALAGTISLYPELEQKYEPAVRAAIERANAQRAQAVETP